MQHPIENDREREISTEHGSRMPQRMAEERIPYQGPAHPTKQMRKRRATFGLAIAILLVALLTVIVLLQGPVR